ncbi:MAG: hypothetical protein J6M14_05015, partial [Campylobacter sp.]|nr:hypothetical protein [Campylobacter sp.]
MKNPLKFSVVAAATLMAVVPNLALADNTELLGGEFTSSGGTYQGNNGDDGSRDQIIGITIGSNDYSTKDIRAGFSANGPQNREKDAINNEVIMNGGEVNNIYGAVARMLSGNRFTAKNNTVTIGGGKVKGKIYGGYGQSGGNAISNEVSITNGDVSEVYGGSGDTANKNKVTISGGTTSQIFGGNGISEASEHEVLITGGIIKSTVNGGYINGTGTVSNNKVTISDGTVNANVFGGYSYNGLATGNTVTISGGTVSGSVYGGRSVTADAATNNTVIISGGSIEGDVIGGYANSTYPYSNFEATGNTVTYTGGTINGKIRVGYSGYTGADMLTGNTLNIGIADKKISNTLNAENIYNFENLNFYLASGIADGFTALNLTGTGNTDLSKTTVTAYLSDASNLTKDSTVHLIKTAGTLNAPKNNEAEQTNVNIASLLNVKGYIKLDSIAKNLDLLFKDNGGSSTPTFSSVDKIFNITSPTTYTRKMKNDSTNAEAEQEFTISNDFDDELTTIASGIDTPSYSGNTVNVNLGSNSFNNSIFGGGDYSTDTTVSGNTVTLNSGKVWFINGGTALTGEVSDNKVIIKGGTSTSVYGGQSEYGAVSGNSVTISSGIIRGVSGGYSNIGAVSGNSVTITDGTINYNVHGGKSESGAVSGNSVTISGGTINDYVYGGNSHSGTVSGNSVTISGGTINYDVFGGFSSDETASGNFVTITDGTINRDVVGGFSIYNTATNNTVNFTGGTIKGTIYGGISDDSTKEVLAGNELNIGTSDKPVIGLSAANIANFENINFYLPSTVSNGDTALSLTTTEDTGLYGTNVNAYLSNANGLTKDSVIHLISTQGTLVDFDETKGKANLSNVSIAGLINITGKIAVDDTQKNLDLSFSGDEDTGGGSGSGGSGSGGGNSGGGNSGGGNSSGGSTGGGSGSGGSTGGGSTGGGSTGGGSTGGGSTGGGSTGGGSTGGGSTGGGSGSG